MKEIKLTNGNFTTVDDEDYEYLSKFTWRQTKNGYVFSGKRINGRQLIMHRVVMNTPKGLQTDHIDHNTLNNCKSNLRNCSITQNQGNKRLSKVNKTGYKGVFLVCNKWYARVKVSGKITQVSCDSKIDAAKAYDKLARELFGEFAYVNFPSQSALNGGKG